MTAAGVRAGASPSVWRELGREAPTPFQTEEWYAAAGWLDRISVVGGEDGALPVWVVAEDEHSFHSPRAQLCGRREESFLAGAERELAAARAAEWGPTAVTISPYGYRGGPLTRAASPAAPASLADELLAAAEERGVRCAVSHFLFEDRDADWIDALVARGGVPVVLGADAVLAVAWPDADTYYRSLGRRRGSLRRRANAARREPVDLIVREGPGAPDDPDDVVDVLAASAAQHDPRTPPPRGLLATLVEGRVLPRILACVVEPGAGLRTAACVLARGTTLFPKLFGTRRPRSDYLRVAYDWLVRYAIDGGYERIEYGGGSHQAKLLRGARLRYSIGVYLFLDPALREAVEPLARRLGGAKLAHFRELSGRWHLDHEPTPVPRAVRDAR